MAVHVHGVVGWGRALEGAPVARVVGGRARVDDRPLTVYGELEAQAVGVGVGRELGRAGRAHVGYQVQPLARAYHDVPGRAKNRQGSLWRPRLKELDPLP